MHVMKCSLGHGLLCAVCLFELHHESSDRCCTGATLEQHHGYGIWGYVLAVFWLNYSYIMAMLWLLVWLERINVSVIPMAPQVSFQPLSLNLAYPEFNNQQDNSCNWQDSQQIEEPKASMIGWRKPVPTTLYVVPGGPSGRLGGGGWVTR